MTAQNSFTNPTLLLVNITVSPRHRLMARRRSIEDGPCRRVRVKGRNHLLARYFLRLQVYQADEIQEVTKDFIEFDGWGFPLSDVTKSLLAWLHASFIRWAKEDDSKKNKEWINGFVEALQDGLAGGGRGGPRTVD